ncbi:LysR family transcriptional regulator [Amycolatopsis sp. NPDC005232]|uniref:LysR family transcriptional regulator n=1 Tax=Amycolatopsis sp. NPDC005232 TaxID=3157027 RepID=UPI0033A10F24
MTTLRALECLVALVDHGSVTRAATSLQMSQPALSHQISAIERELGTPVAEKLGRGVRITAAGRAVAEEARVSLAAAERAVHIGLQIAAGERGTLRIACVETMAAPILLPVLRRWRASHTDVVIEVSEHSSAEQMVVLLNSGRIELAIGPRPPETHSHAEVLGAEDVVVVAPAGHEFGRRLAVPLEDLGARPFIHYSAGTGLAQWVDRVAVEHGVVLDPVLRTRSPSSAARLAAAGMGVAVVPLSGLSARPSGVVRRLAPLIHRELVVMTASPADVLANAFAADLVRSGLPVAEVVP